MSFALKYIQDFIVSVFSKICYRCNSSATVLYVISTASQILNISKPQLKPNWTASQRRVWLFAKPAGCVKTVPPKSILLCTNAALEESFFIH